MGDHAADHLKAATRHDSAADNHERAARFWDDREDRARAKLQREMAEHERRGAVLERRWAELVEPTSPPAMPRAAEIAITDARHGAEQLSAMLTRTAIAPERTAELADQHAVARQRAGRGDDAAAERQAAERARGAARRARSQAAEWFKTCKHPGT